MNTSSNKSSLIGNTIESFKTLVAYDLSNCRVVFENEGDEIVFINESWIGRVRIYLNGSLAYSGWDWSGMMLSSGWFFHNNKTYKVKSVISNLLTFDQKVTLSVDSDLVDTKEGTVYGKLTLKEIAHVMCGAGVMGVLIVGILKIFGI